MLSRFRTVSLLEPLSTLRMPFAIGTVSLNIFPGQQLRMQCVVGLCKQQSIYDVFVKIALEDEAKSFLGIHKDRSLFQAIIKEKRFHLCNPL